jgi:hypothetical protein
MYFSGQHHAVDAVGDLSRFAPWRHLCLVSSNVLFLGLTSMLTDISAEMVAVVLPIYLTIELRWSALHFGIFDSLYQGISVLLRPIAGCIADRHQRYKEVASIGYALSTGCKLGLMVAQGAWLPTTVCLFLDRTGKGIRTAPRDTLIALSSPRSARAAAFGVHRALDSAGALVGPLLAFSFLGLFPGNFDGLFVMSFAMGLLGLATLMLFVDNLLPPSLPKLALATRSWPSIVCLLWIPSFRRLLLAAAPLSLLSVTPLWPF